MPIKLPICFCSLFKSPMMKDILIISFLLVVLCGCSKNEDLPSGDLNVLIYPNPTTGVMTITLDNPDTYTIEITSVSSDKLIYSDIMIGITKMLDISSSPNGFYYVKVTLADSFGRVKIEKISGSNIVITLYLFLSPNSDNTWTYTIPHSLAIDPFDDIFNRN